MFVALIYHSWSRSSSAIGWPPASIFSRGKTSLITMFPTNSQTIGTNLRLGFALTEEIAFQPRYTFYQQKITLPTNLNDCQFSSMTSDNGGPGVNPTE